MRVLVTGAAGFIGSHVLRALAEKDVEAAGLVRPGADRWRLQGLSPAVPVFEADLADAAATRMQLDAWPPDVCIHLAWYAVPGRYLHARENVDCVISSLHLFEELSARGCGGLVVAGTCFEYDLHGVTGCLREDAPLAPATLYAAAKHALHTLAEACWRQTVCRLSWARIFYLYGPQEDERRLVPALIRSLLQGREFPASAGAQVRDYLHVEDVAEALCRLALGGADGAFNIASGEPVSISDLMRMVGAIVNRSDLLRLGALPYREGDPMYVCGDPTKLRSETGWTPRHSLHDGLAATVEWWSAQAASLQ
jgi:nucleoside-diphosphate-sugar epimerase